MVFRWNEFKSGEQLTISINESKIKHVNCMNYLGLEIDDALSWNNHVNRLCKSLFFKISKFVRLSKSLPKEILTKIYNASIQPVIDYVISVWGCTTLTNINKVQRLQNYCAQIIEKNFDYINYRGLNLVKKQG